MIIKNPDPLDFAYVPERLRFREQQLKKIREIVLQPVRNGIFPNLVIYGASGTGKTATIKLLLREEKSPTIIYENALSFGNIRTLLSDVINKLGKVFPSRAASYNQIFGAINTIMKKRGTSLVLVIDEASNIARRDPDGFYNLFRSNEIYETGMSTILVSIDNPTIYFTERDRKSLGVFSALEFSKYTRDELYGIIDDRCKVSLEDSAYTPSILDYISEIAEHFGSARVAIELLQKASHIADYRSSDTIEGEDIRAAKSLINPYVTESKLGELEKEELVLLLTVCSCLKNATETQLDCLVENAPAFAEQYSMEGMDRKDIYRILKKLEVVGFLDSKTVSGGDKKGVRKVISISDVPVAVLSEKIELMLGQIA
ncbi:hypothetical protein IX51_02605 [uncultured archaeon]|nr:hypothetical protein IX51_02605 [uncultured archaeon]